MKGIMLLLTFFTRIPIRKVYSFDEEEFIKGIKFMPLIGLVIGGFLLIAVYLEEYIHRPILSILIWIMYICLTGALHIDGLSDTIDGIFSNRNKERMLEIMKDSRIGAFGVISIVTLLALNISLTVYIPLKYLFIMPVVGRSFGIISCSISKYARSEGMGKLFIENCGAKEGIIAIIFLIVFGIPLYSAKFILPIGLCFIATMYFTRFFKRVLGGMTGDTIGFIIEITQSIFLIIIYLLRGWMI
ncbi:adenosylcobinamide-GDP ribazoletransferase [Clostridium sp. D2Q-11]|uniref:Adenosylcobinamide-GDP ribazoletransferase n=1 Tax=Anaeromonas frigoriresistens TaxID=2683708 RepID=A0A942USY6_9FIRM|nr:adenosylcobinamide-GDP ribazoletransferase [Anaeromonas frigoriresistens]